jgi:hypothetical protein
LCLDKPKLIVLNPFRGSLPAHGGEGDAFFRSPDSSIEAMVLQREEEKQADFEGWPNWLGESVDRERGAVYFPMETNQILS